MTKTKKPENRIGKKYKKAVRVDLTDEEVAAKDKRVRVLENKIAKKQTEMKPFKDAVRDMRAEIKRLADDAESGTEERDTYVFDEFVFTKNEVQTKLVEGEKVVDKRAMTAGEREEELDLPEPGIPDDVDTSN